MRLYLRGNSKNEIGYVPDWIKIYYEEGNREYELVLDIQGSIDYSDTKLDCRCKGDLIPWVLWDFETGEEIDLYELSEEEIEERFPDKVIAKSFTKSHGFTVGVYPMCPCDMDEHDLFELAGKDKITECEGYFECYVDDEFYEVNFVFDTELNI